ncbi:3-deoxy-D-manno-octulosonic acid transferase [Achromobacter anxifer]|uniref:3-deoxy-D-manno-octulosonic acid transferase n=1 Tax=Achromobacter anxifer TaxID=1287737 RepID=A0A6S7D9Q4_9BURK|nr:3-deoxy-D-manno-octulosonic acid transferase [Achromobacter anxifer]MDF8363487.1 3-deoxy-D-manno-octulosonic acid transferase [Achromobacter anxifer]CAB3883992.1 3-deoxy-D-manno-octulosonic acid transferase [Achromobacter anxifer]CAB5514790.1 3-deoxy-D-manno-octulosonic acid transferase [Achromobacter anxifer]
MNRGVYSLALRALSPLVWLWMGHRARRAGGQWEIFSPERFGHAADAASSSPSWNAPVWVHAVSLGETRAAQPLVQALLDRGLPLLLTHMTATGRAEGARLFAEAIARGQLRQAWMPYDFPGAARRFMAAYRPRCGLLIEREIWPNLLAAARGAGVPMALVSARFSASSLRQAGRMGGVMREALGGLDAVLAQTAEDAARLAQAGAPQPVVTGNLKFDLVLPPVQVGAGQAWRARLGRPVVAVASTREGEDSGFIEAIKRHAASPGAPLFLLIPRHPQRFDEAARLLSEAGLPYARRSEGREPGADTAVLLGDTLGEMAFYYAASDVAIVAGSFAPLGGQNLIEACAAGVPVIVGPHTFNFKQAAEDAIAAGAAQRTADPGQAVDAALALLADESRRRRAAEAALAWFGMHAGATGRTLDALAPWLEGKGAG